MVLRIAAGFVLLPSHGLVFVWTDCSDASPWRTTIRSHESWLAEMSAAGKQVANLFKISGLRLEGVMIDTLHAIDQGIAVHAIANIFVEVMALNPWGSNKKANVAGLERDMKLWYKTANKKAKSSKLQGSLTFERIKTAGDWPKLKAKAAATRHLARYAACLAARYDTGTTHDRRRRAVADLLVAFYDIVEDDPDILSQAAFDSLKVIGKSLLECYLALSSEALALKQRAWKCVPKFHIFIHLCEIQCHFRNPRCFWVYADEDLQRHIGEIATSCAVSNLAQMVLYKWLVLVFDTDAL
jgi:hypothetical protein